MKKHDETTDETKNTLENNEISRNACISQKSGSQIKQGDCILQTLFNLVPEGKIRKANLNSKNIMTNQIEVIAHAKDLSIIASTKTAVIRLIDKLDKEARILELQINEDFLGNAHQES